MKRVVGLMVKVDNSAEIAWPCTVHIAQTGKMLHNFCPVIMLD